MRRGGCFAPHFVDTQAGRSLNFAVMKKLFAFAFFAVSTCASLSQVVAGSSFFDQIASDWHMGITADVMESVAVPSGVYGGDGGTLGVYKTAAVVKAQGSRNRHTFDISAGWERSRFDFSHTSPFSDTNDFSANAFYSYAIDQKWSVFGAARGGFAAEEGADLSDGGRLLAGGGVGYVFDENLAFGIGMMAVSRMDNTWLPLPLGYLRWKIDEKLSLRTLNGVALIYDVFGDSSLLLNASCEYDNSYFRLKKGGTAKRSVGDNFVNIAVGATYNIGKNFYVSGSVGANVYRKLYFRYGGHSNGEYSCDPAPVFFVHLGCKL